MVEKIIVSPDSVRGWGNIVMEHTVDDYALVGSSILVDSDTVMGVESVVYTIEAEDSSISVVLSASVDSCYIGDSVVLSATVTDDGEPVEGGTVTFKLNTTTLGTDETDANGVATYTYTTTDVGSLNFTALYESHNSNTVSVVVSHDYSIAFDSSSYTTSTGDVTAYVTLLDNSNPVSGASISLTGTGSTVTATTNSSGVATFNLTGISSDCTITATYENVSDTATVTVGPSIPYQQVEYLQSNGSQYINTGYILKATDKVEVTVSMQSQGTYNGIFGARKGSASNNCYALFGRFDGQPKFVYARTGHELKGQQHSHDVIYNINTNQGTCTISENGTVIETLNNTGTINDCYNPCGLFTVNTASGTGFTKDTYGYNKIYYFKITDSNDNVIMELYPVRDGTTGYMYDTVSESLMSKTGTFLYGNDI